MDHNGLQNLNVFALVYHPLININRRKIVVVQTPSIGTITCFDIKYVKMTTFQNVIYLYGERGKIKTFCNLIKVKSQEYLLRHYLWERV